MALAPRNALAPEVKKSEQLLWNTAASARHADAFKEFGFLERKTQFFLENRLRRPTNFFLLLRARRVAFKRHVTKRTFRATKHLHLDACI